MEKEPISDELKNRLNERLKNSHVNKLFHFAIEDIKKNYCIMSLAYREEITNGQKSKGTIHGGIVAALIDTAAAFALSTRFDGQMSFATVDLHVNFLDRAQTKIFAHAQVIRTGSRLNVVDVDVMNEHGERVAKASLNFILTKPMEEKN
jgi:acyl-CoA thioesterase